MWSYSRSIVNQTHHSSVIIIITITAYHCSLFNVYQTVTACYCAKIAGCSHCLWEFIFRRQNMLFPFPLELFQFPFPLLAQNYSNCHGNPMGMGIPIPMHTSTLKLWPYGAVKICLLGLLLLLLQFVVIANLIGHQWSRNVENFTTHRITRV